MPLPNSRLLHPRFHENLRRSAVGDAGLPDGCLVERTSTTAPVIDPDTAAMTVTDSTTVFAGPCRVQADATQDSTVVIGDQAVALHRYRASIPHDAPQILVDDVFTVTSSADLQLIGRPLVVRDVHYDTFQVRRYLLLEDHPQTATPGEEE